MFGWVWPGPKRKGERKYVGPRLSQPFGTEIGPTVSWVSLGPVTRASPAHLF